MLSLRLATLEDTEALVTLCEELFDSSVYSKSSIFDHEIVRNQAKKIVSSPLQDGAIFVLHQGEEGLVGCLACSHYTPFWSQEDKVAVEIVFHLRTASRSYIAYKLLLGAFKRWAKLVGCSHIQVGKIKNNTEVESYKVWRLQA